MKCIGMKETVIVSRIMQHSEENLRVSDDAAE